MVLSNITGNLIIISIFLFAVAIKPSSTYQSNICASKTKCHECIQTRKCVWCSQPTFDKQRCFLPETTDLSHFCDTNSTVNPLNEYIVIENKTLTNRQAKKLPLESKSITQISPQRATLKLRKNEEYHIKLNFSQAADYPIDLYFLMDVSISMEEHKNKLSNLTDSLYETMENISSKFHLGFGLFLEKNMMPYISTHPIVRRKFYNGVKIYSYQHVMKLSNDTKTFSNLVKNASVYPNNDIPEASFDAIMQAIACKDQIGWRDQARRLLLVSTDAGFHYAGDGKLAGIIEPNDGKCHLDEHGFYTYDTVQDYPSIPHINRKAKEQSIHMIFAVTASQKAVYDNLATRIEGSSTAELNANSSNIVKLVKDQYYKITSSVILIDNATSDIQITYESNCLNKTTNMTNQCNGLKVGDVVSFSISVLVKSCPKNKQDWNQIIKISPIGINESLLIDLEMLCDCSCKHDHKLNAENCNSQGSYECGVCECNDNHFGESCECSTDNVPHLKTEDIVNMTSHSCSNHGQCVCGKCECEKRANDEEKIYGKFCECDNFSCARHNGKLCSGPNQGSCECGQCACKPGWIGHACDCPTSNNTCILPGSTDICSGHGECVCGQCRCEVSQDIRYSGKYCDKCPTCTGRCNEFKECVQCQIYKKGPLAEPELCVKNCTLFVPIIVDELNVDEDKYETCTFYDEDKCLLQFSYSDNNDKIEIKAIQHLECTSTVSAWKIALSCIVATVLIGLATLLLGKFLTHQKDKREYEQFFKERDVSKWHLSDNLLYKKAITTYINPTYNKDD